MPRLSLPFQQQKNFESERIDSCSVSECLQFQLDLAEKYIALGQKKAAKFALVIVSELWKAEKPEGVKERYKTAVKNISELVNTEVKYY